MQLHKRGGWLTRFSRRAPRQVLPFLDGADGATSLSE